MQILVHICNTLEAVIAKPWSAMPWALAMSHQILSSIYTKLCHW